MYQITIEPEGQEIIFKTGTREECLKLLDNYKEGSYTFSNYIPQRLLTDCGSGIIEELEEVW